MKDGPVLIAGGGPVGIVTALALARRGISVRVFEAADRVNDAPRASTLHPSTLEMLASIGLIDDVIAQGVVARTFQFWDRPNGRMIAEFDHAILKDDTAYPFVVQCEQHKLVKLGMRRLQNLANARIRQSSRVVAANQFGDHVEITIETATGRETVAGRYLMLELYHHGSSVCAAKVRFVLLEKGLEWTGHYIDILKGDQFDPAYIKLNSKAVVPTLVHDGHTITESTVICEYLDEVFPTPGLTPADARSRAAMRLWTKAVDETLHPACGEITFPLT